MIAHITGTVISKGERYAVIETNGVGYKIFVNSSINRVLTVGAEGKLWTHQHVREDAIELYGFLYAAELEFFELLIGISGIGPRSALGVLALASVDALKKAIGAGDTSYLTKVSGIGRKTAEKIILELRDKMGFGKDGMLHHELGHDADVLDALISLGYSQKDAREILNKIPDTITGREARLKEALRFLHSK